MKEDRVLERLRGICLALPETDEVRTWGHPTFRARKKAFAVLEEYKGELSLAFKVDMRHRGLFLKDPRFYRTPYIGRPGWVSQRVGGRVNWTEVKHLVSESYRLVTAPYR